ncbi:MAG TPA: site-specific DNA-methyltransferase [Thermoplasmata archaeon]|nr:site-specific DNA-methyltransferase [Thermoplasmata archaeon]
MAGLSAVVPVRGDGEWGPVRIIEGDARDLPTIPPRSVHLIVTSPPYPMIPQWDELFEELGARDYESMHGILDAAWRAAARVLVPGGILAINVGDALRRVDDEFRLWPNHARILESVERLGLRPLPYILWKKPTNKPNAFLGSGFLPPNAYVTLDCEFILLFRNGGLRSFPPRDPNRHASGFSRGERDRWFSQVWEDIRGAPQSRGDRRTAAFPDEVPARLIRMFSCRGETVLDPFAGTGTTLWAAARAGRTALGVERDPALVSQLRERASEGSSPRPTPGARAPRPRRA